MIDSHPSPKPRQAIRPLCQFGPDPICLAAARDVAHRVQPGLLAKAAAASGRNARRASSARIAEIPPPTRATVPKGTAA